jgi:hypothetical protein
MNLKRVAKKVVTGATKVKAKLYENNLLKQVKSSMKNLKKWNRKNQNSINELQENHVELILRSSLLPGEGLLGAFLGKNCS